MSDILKILRQSELFKTLPEDTIAQEILPHGQILSLIKKQQIIMPQQHMDTFFVVLAGKIHIEYNLPGGGSSLQGVLTAGDVLGAEWICSDQRVTSCCAEAVSAAKIASFPNEMVAVRGLLNEAHRLEIINRLLLLLSRDNIRLQYHQALLSLKGLRERIVMYLLQFAEQNQSDTFEIPLTREEMAEILCVNRSCLSHELSLMEQDGMISFVKSRFTLHDLENRKY